MLIMVCLWAISMSASCPTFGLVSFGCGIGVLVQGSPDDAAIGAELIVGTTIGALVNFRIADDESCVLIALRWMGRGGRRLLAAQRQRGTDRRTDEFLPRATLLR
jgi:hypothetical protein